GRGGRRDRARPPREARRRAAGRGSGVRGARRPPRRRRRRGARRPPRGSPAMTTTPARIDGPVPPSATLAINERIEQRIRGGADVLHLAFGEAQFPLLPSVAEVLDRAAGRTSYGPVAGSAEARAAAAGYFERRGIP